MKLSDLEPHWVGLQPGHAIGMTFLCPHCRKTRIGVLFDVPIGAYEPCDMIAESLRNAMIKHCVEAGMKQWHRTGETFDNLSLQPSIDTSQFQHWHGHIENGEIR